MRVNKGMKTLFGVFLICVLLIAFGAVNVSAARIRLKYAHQNNVYDADQLCAETFKSLVEEQSNRNITVTIYPGTLTTSEEEALEYMRSGSVDIGANSAGHISGFYKDIQFLQLPYLFKSKEHYYVSRQSAVLKEILDELGKATGLIPLGIYSDCNGFAICSLDPIRTLQDCKGMKLRCMQNPLFIDMYEAWNFDVTPTDWGELYTSLQTGLVEANDLGAYCQYVFKLAEVVDCMAATNHCWTQKVIFISPKAWNKMDNKQKEIVRIAAQQAVELTDQFQYVKEVMALEKAKDEGYTVTYPNLDPFKRASQKVYDEWFKRYPHWEKWYEEIQYLDPDARTPKAGMPKIE
jgi:TRAP-type C4-dicarboxylate transport system substrate-binding protein